MIDAIVVVGPGVAVGTGSLVSTIGSVSADVSSSPLAGVGSGVGEVSVAESAQALRNSNIIKAETMRNCLFINNLQKSRMRNDIGINCIANQHLAVLEIGQVRMFADHPGLAFGYSGSCWLAE